MEITKPILHTGILEYASGNVEYTEEFLKKLAESKGAKVELNQHDGEEIGTIKSLEYKDSKLYATMDIPDEYKADTIAFSTDITPNTYQRVNSNTFAPTDGNLDAVVYVNNGEKVRDVKTITRLNNMADKEGEDDNMDKELAQKLGALQTQYDALKEKNETLENQVQTLTSDKEELQTQLDTKTNELKEVNQSLSVYKEGEAKEKEDLIKTLVADEKDPLNQVYEKMELEDLKLIGSTNKKPDTQTKGVGTKTIPQNSGEDGDDETDENGFKKYDYTKAKESMNIR